MRKNIHIALVSLLITVVFMPTLRAQEDELNYNPLSLYPVSYDRILFKRTLWRRIDMKEKQNQPFFSREKEISTLIIDAVKNGLLTPYTNDSVTTPMQMEAFLENLKLPDAGGGLSEEEMALGFGEEEDDSGWGDEGGDTEIISESNEYPSRDFSIVEIKEDYFFDVIRSRMYHDIHAFTIILPADKNPALFEKPIASFRFVDLANLFRSTPERSIWFNTQNPAKHLNMTDAFLLRLFSSTITKIANPQDEAIVDIYSKSRKQAAMASQQAEHALIDFENQLWEY